MKRILVCGGRWYGVINAKRPLEHPARRAERRNVRAVLDGLFREFGPFILIHGAASGADSLAADWVEDRRAEGAAFPEPIAFPAAWDDLSAPGAVVRTGRRGRSYNVVAGFQRNQRMIDEGKPDLVVAFPGAEGTADMTARARKAGTEVREPK